MMCWSCQRLHGMRPGRAQTHLVRFGELEELPASLDDEAGGFGEGLAASGPHLDLGRDQLADQMLFQRSAARRGLQLLEVVGELERLGVEQRELLLDGEREVLAAVEGVAGAPEQLLPRNRLRFTH